MPLSSKCRQPFQAKTQRTEKLDGFHPRGRIHNFSEADTETLANHHHLAFGDHGAVGKNVERVTGKAVKLDDRSLI